MTVSEMLSHNDVTPDHFIASSLINDLVYSGSTLAIAEGCSGGNIVNSLTIPGSTRVFRLGCVAYSKEAKIHLGVPDEIIDGYGEYSLEVAIEMAKSIRKIRNDSLAIATVGYIDQDKTQNAPIVHFGFAKKDGSTFGRSFYLNPDSRHSLKSQISAIGLSLGLMINKNHSVIDFKPDFFVLPETQSDSQTKLEYIVHPVLSKLHENNLKIATMESCTGGAIADAITNIPGASNIFDSCWVTYDENSKALLGVPLLTMANGSVYSERVAIAMAKAILDRTGVDIAIGTTGAMDTIDRRPFHTDTHPGTVYIAITTRKGFTFSQRLLLRPNNRDQMKQEVVYMVFQLLDQLLNSAIDSQIIQPDPTIYHK